ncbi:MAG TPA: metalloregulator ArsR/SmtB family transcription factor [Actinotalea sp.]
MTTATVKDLCCSPVLRDELSAEDSTQLAAALRVLADPVRLRLISLIRVAPGGRAVTRDLVTRLDVAQPTVSHHLGVLHDAGFVRRSREGRETWYAIEPDAFSAVSGLLEPGASD